jgi:polyphosphate kinase 2 (PPK2 family)
VTAAPSVGDLLRIEPGSGAVDLSTIDPRCTPGTDLGKDGANAELEQFGDQLADLQERLFAEGRMGGERRLLLVLQGMDTSGKGGAVKSVARQVNPVGLRITGFGPPTAQEREHDFLWRINKAVPAAGLIGVFDRSHDEDVLIVRVHDLVPPGEWQTRYDRINEWEAGLADQGVHLLKVMLHLSYDEHNERLLSRLDDPTKHGKDNPADIDERAHWAAYRRPTRSHCSGARPTSRPGTSCRPTASGTATGRCPTCCLRLCRAWTRSGRSRRWISPACGRHCRPPDGPRTSR